jgi:hypothetical protein
MDSINNTTITDEELEQMLEDWFDYQCEVAMGK